jgi:predicted Zn-dependent protease
VSSESTQARDELQTGTVLTRQGRFREAIPHLEKARAGLGNEYPIEFDLSLCYIGAGEYTKAIRTLDDLRRQKHDNADVENLLAQAYIGIGQRRDALDAVERAAAISPKNEKLFAFVADACRDAQDFELGLDVIDIGLRDLPQSARLHYERAFFLSDLDRFDSAKPDFELAAKLGQGTEIEYTALAHQRLLEGNIVEAVRTAREGVHHGVQNPGLLVILGKALLLSGVAPGQTEFTEAQKALEKVSLERPRDAGALIGLGQLDLLSSRMDDAIAHLEAARRMRPSEPSIYASLAKAYHRKGDAQRAQEAIATLESLNQAQADRIRNAPGERKTGYTGTPSAQPK